jgi:hypothetical protein
MSHWLTNRGKYRLTMGDWDDLASGDIYVGLLAGASVPTGIDTEAEVQDLNTVNDLLSITSVDEPSAGWYSRKTLSRTNAVEDDTNNRVNLDAADVVWSSATAGTSIYGAFVAHEVGTDSQDELLSVIIFSGVTATNGGDVTLAIADLYRAS